MIPRRRITEENCSGLIQSIAKEGGNHIPIIARPIAGDSLHVEVIAGTRRHFAVDRAGREDPNLELLAIVVDLTDEQAFRIADLENREREDVSPIERARNYKWAVENLYEGKQQELAEALNLSKGWISKMLRIATLPDDVLRAFASPADLPAEGGYKLACRLDDEGQRSAIMREAELIARDQADPRLPAISGRAVLRRLLAADGEIRFPVRLSWPSSSGQPALSIKKKSRDGLLLLVHKNSDATEDELIAAFRDALRREPQNGGFVTKPPLSAATENPADARDETPHSIAVQYQ
jgi:ParB family chromosome partitioning protein